VWFCHLVYNITWHKGKDEQAEMKTREDFSWMHLFNINHF